jgi:hypothetical protein
MVNVFTLGGESPFGKGESKKKKNFGLKYSQFSWVLKALEGEASP